jgi:intein/homing endonuclease
VKALYLSLLHLVTARDLMQIRLYHILITEPTFEDGMSRPFKKIDPIELDELTNQYSDKEVGEMLGHSRWAVTQARLRFGVKSFYEKTGLKRNVKGEAGCTYGGRKRIYSFNENFFSTIESEKQAYFLGFLAADGSVIQNLKGVELTLHEKDINTLLLFKEAIGGTSPELACKPRKNGSNHYRLTLISRQMATDLNAWGLTPAKTYTLQIQKTIPDDLLRHFLRGLWDGDGYIGDKSFGLLTASPDFANQLEQWIYQVSRIVLPRRLQKSRDKLYPVISGCTKSHALFLKAMYEDCNYFMERKRDKFSRFWS